MPDVVENLYVDQQTLYKVRSAIIEAGHDAEEAEKIINLILNKNVVFREIRRSK